MTPIPSLTASSASASPTRTLSSSDSTTHGPAMRNGLLSAANLGAPPAPPVPARPMSVRQLGQLARRRGACLELPVIDRGAYEPGEQRMGTHRPRLELGMELATDEPRMLRQLDHLHERAIGRQPGRPQAVLRQDIAVRVRYLVTVAMPLAHFRSVVRLGHARPGPQATGIGAEPHRAAHFLNPFLRAHQRDHRIRALGCELARVRIRDLADVARELDDRGLRAEADPEKRQLVLTRPPNRLEHAFDSAHAEAAGHQQSVVAGEQLARGLLIGKAIGRDPLDLDP